MAVPDSPPCGGSKLAATSCLPGAAAAAGAAGAAEAAALLSLQIAHTAHAVGEQNGLRHGDYRRYREYLSRRLGRLRQQLDSKQGRHRYIKKPLPELITSNRYLLLVLLQAERAWAYGMQLKADNASTAKPNARLRAHSIRRFAKAVVYARQLEALCKGPPRAPRGPLETEAAADKSGAAAAAAAAAAEGEAAALCDGRTCLDAEAYRYFMESVLQQEKEQWVAAAATLQQLQQLYIQLKRLSSTQPEVESIYKQKIDALDPLLRLCLFYSGDIRGSAAAAQQEAASSREKAAAAAGVAAAAAAAAASSSSGCIAIWRGAPVDPKKERPRAAVAAALARWKSVQLFAAEGLRQLAATPAMECKETAAPLFDRDPKEWTEQYGEASARFQSCLDTICNEILADRDETPWLHVLGLCSDMIRCVDVERDALMLLRCLFSLAAADADLRGMRELLRAQEGFRFANLLLQGLERMQQEDTLPESRRPQLQRWIQISKDSKATCLATAIACQGNLAEAFVLARAVSTRQVLLTLQAELRGDPQERVDLLLAAIQKATVVAVGQRVCRYLCALLRQTQDIQGPVSAVENADDAADTPAQKRLNSTVGRLLLPSPEPVACKPHLFDLAISSLSPPDLSAKTAGARAGIGGLLKSLWRR